jgi:hypothetical protein
LYKWIASSGNNSVDATTGATLSSHQTHTITWDCNDLSGNEVPDGEYHIFVEYTDKHAQGPWTMVTFIKGPDEQHITLEDQPYLKDMQLDFIPLINGLNLENDTKNLLIYPNPGNGLFHIQNNFNEDVCIQIFDARGNLVYNFNYSNSASNKEFILDLSNIPNGLYFVNLYDKKEHFVNKLVVQ